MMWFTVGFIVELLLNRLRRVVSDDTFVFRNLSKIRCRYLLDILGKKSYLHIISSLKLEETIWVRALSREELPRMVSIALGCLCAAACGRTRALLFGR